VTTFLRSSTGADHMASTPPDLPSLDELGRQIYEATRVVEAVREPMRNRTDLEGTLKDVEQWLFEAEYCLDRAMNLIDPNTVS